MKYSKRHWCLAHQLDQEEGTGIRGLTNSSATGDKVTPAIDIGGLSHVSTMISIMQSVFSQTLWDLALSLTELPTLVILTSSGTFRDTHCRFFSSRSEQRSVKLLSCRGRLSIKCPT